MDVSRQVLEVFFGVHQQRFEAPLKQVPASPALDIEIDGVADIDPLDGTAQVRFGSFHQKMVMVGHQAVRVNADGKTLAGGFQIFQKSFTVADDFAYAITGITAIDCLAKGAWIVYAKWPDQDAQPLGNCRAIHLHR